MPKGMSPVTKPDKSSGETSSRYGVGEDVSASSPTNPEVTVSAPQPNDVERYARHLCRHWGQTRSPAYHKQTFVRGFADFMKLIVRIQVEHAGEPSCPKKSDPV